uniref:Uncharacterized protein n=1 Tax=Cucumis melo TaxID=3656 RepID=A0A9I9EM54_CUCME
MTNHQKVMEELPHCILTYVFNSGASQGNLVIILHNELFSSGLSRGLPRDFFGTGFHVAEAAGGIRDEGGPLSLRVNVQLQAFFLRLNG